MSRQKERNRNMPVKPKVTQENFIFYDRPHHRTTTLTVDSDTYKRVANLKPGEETEVEFVNDIVSSAHGGNSIDHHSIRRIDLLRRQISTAFRNVKVRTEMGTCVTCIIRGSLRGASDRCSARATVTKRY